jgi:hypothetical protein
MPDHPGIRGQNCLLRTGVVALAVDVPEPQLTRWADAGLVAPAGAEPDGTRLRDVDALRRQIARYVDTSDHDNNEYRRGGTWPARSPDVGLA